MHDKSDSNKKHKQFHIEMDKKEEIHNK